MTGTSEGARLRILNQRRAVQPGCKVTLFDRTVNGNHYPTCGQPIADITRQLCLEHVKERLRLL